MPYIVADSVAIYGVGNTVLGAKRDARKGCREIDFKADGLRIREATPGLVAAVKVGGGCLKWTYLPVGTACTFEELEKRAAYIEKRAAEIVQEVDDDYEDGPCDGAEACENAFEFVDYHMEGYPGQQCGRDPSLRKAVEEGLLNLYDPRRHGPDAEMDEDEDEGEDN